MPEITINIDVYCSKCGAGLCRQTDVDENRGNHVFSVYPCEKCLTKAHDEGYAEGLEEKP